MGRTLYKVLPHRGKPYNKRKSVSECFKTVGRIGIEQRPAVANLKQDSGYFKIIIN